MLSPDQEPKIIGIPYIHSLIDLAHIDEKGNILPKYGHDIKVDDVNVRLYTRNSLGEGAFGHVLIGQNLETNEWYAIKTLKSEAKQSAHLIKELKTEEKFSRLAGQLIAIDYSTAQMVMKLAPGVPLGKFPFPDLTTAELLEICQAIIKSVLELHEAKIIHRDIKPANMLLSHDKKATPVDLGLAIFDTAILKSQRKEVAGTPTYIAPESTKDGIYSTKTDAYQVGMSLARMLKLTSTTYGYLPNTDRYVVCSRSSEIFIKNRTIRNPNIRAFIHLIATSLTDPDSSKRMSLADAYAQIQRMKEQQLNIASMMKNVGIINIEDYLTLSPADKKHCHTALRCFDEINLVDTDSVRHAKIYNQVRRELEENGIRVGNKLAHHPDPLKAAAILAAQSEAHQIKTLFYVTPPAKPLDAKQNAFLNSKGMHVIQVNHRKKDSDYKKEILSSLKSTPVIQKHRDMILGKLVQEKSRLSSKKDAKDIINRRIEYIDICITKIKEPSLNYADAYEMLLSTEYRMTARTGIKGIFNLQSAGAKVIKNIREQALSWEEELKQESPRLGKRK